MEDNEVHATQVSFNFAVATLMRLDKILQTMFTISQYMDGIPEQKLQIKLAREFLKNCAPLLVQISGGKAKYEEFKKKIYALHVPTKIMRGRNYEYFSSALLDEITDVIMEIQIELKDHFMPARKEEDEDDY